MKKILTLFAVLHLFLLHDGLIAQSVVGKIDNYAGSMALSLNPSSVVSSNLYADFGLNTGLVGYNDYFYFKSMDLLKWLADGNNNKPKYEKTISGYPRYFDINFKYESVEPIDINVATDINIFSGMYNIDGEHSVGLFFRNRSNIGIENLSAEMVEMFVVGTHYWYDKGEAGFNKDTLVHYNQYARDYPSSNVNLGLMEWSEVGLSYSQTIFDMYDGILDVGVNLKLCLGHAAMTMVLDDFNFSINSVNGNVDDTLIKIDAIKGKIAYSLPIYYDKDFSDFISKDAGDYFKGIGGAVDIGFTYVHKRGVSMKRKTKWSCERRPVDYDWKVGLSLLDLGCVNFKDGEQALFDASNKEIDRTNFDGVKTFHDLVDAVCQPLDTKREDAAFTMGMPTALSVQADYSFNRHFFLCGAWIQPISLMKQCVRREPQLMIAPRYESEKLDFSLPITLMNYERVLVGASLRVAFLTVGTQNLLNLVGAGDTYGLDFYVALKFDLAKGKCLSRRDACYNASFGNKKYLIK